MMEKRAIVRILEQMALIHEILGSNTFRVRAFVNGAQALEDWEGDLEAQVEAGTLTEIHGIGKGLSGVISDLVRTDGSAEYEELRSQLPAGLLELKKIPGVGPKKIRALHEQLGVGSIDDLEKACQEQRVQELRGFGKKTEAEILERIQQRRNYSGRHKVPKMERVAWRFRDAVAAAPGVVRTEIGGSLRRRRETIGDIDLLVATTDPEAAREAFLSVPGIERSEAEGTTKCRVQVEGGVGVDLRVVAPESFAAALHYFTGNKEHNTKLRGLARQRGWKLNEYGLFDENGDALPCPEEENIFGHLGLAYVPPELREGQEEVEYASQNEAFPPLIEEADLQGVLHIHTTASDGRNTLEEMVEAARARGWSYLGVADHSQSAGYVGGLSVARVAEQRAEVQTLNERYDDFRIFHGIESEILADGSLDYPEEILSQFDFVVAAVHSHLDLSKDEQTLRVAAALRNPWTTIWAHPTGRLLLKRDETAQDMDLLLRVAAQEGVIVELNGHPNRLDVDWRWGPRLRELELRVGVFPDAHSVEAMDFVRHGIGTARKAGLQAEHVVNTLSADDVAKLLQERRARAGRSS